MLEKRRTFPSTRMRVIQLAIENCHTVDDLMANRHISSKMRDQIERSSDSVVANGSEAERAIYKKVKIKALGIAIIENNELDGHLRVWLKDWNHPIFDRINHVGRMLTNWVKKARPGLGDQ